MNSRRITKVKCKPTERGGGRGAARGGRREGGAAVSPIAERIMGILRNARLPLEDEARLQEAIAEVLAVRGDGLRVLREQKIIGGLRIDFAVEHYPDCTCRFTGIEVKIAGGKRDIFRQIKAYCEDARLAELIVVTSRPLSLPPSINERPVAIVDLGRAWL